MSIWAVRTGDETTRITAVYNAPAGTDITFAPASCHRSSERQQHRDYQLPDEQRKPDRPEYVHWILGQLQHLDERRVRPDRVFGFDAIHKRSGYEPVGQFQPIILASAKK
jgi:hypothetical protein